jgi:hypothetical protein
MKTTQQLNKDILSITALIKDNYPELVKFLEEMPMDSTEVSSDEMESDNLQEYYDSLSKMVKEYAETHDSNSVKNMN